MADKAPFELNPAPKVEAKQPSPTVAAIEEWFVEHFHGSIVARDTAIYNHVYKAVEELKRRLSA